MTAGMEGKAAQQTESITRVKIHGILLMLFFFQLAHQKATVLS